MLNSFTKLYMKSFERYEIHGSTSCVFSLFSSERILFETNITMVILQMEYPKYVVQRLLNMIRVKLNAPGMIDNEKGELDSSVRPALVYYSAGGDNQS